MGTTEADPRGMTSEPNAIREVPSGSCGPGSEADQVQGQSVDDGGIEVLETKGLEGDKNNKSSKDDRIEAYLNKCDCLIAACPGCHYPCKNCGSRACGHLCKMQRDWQYAKVEVQGRDIIRKFLAN